VLAAGVPVKEYLSAVLPGLDRRTVQQAAELTPLAVPYDALDRTWVD
jgi:hypothetical protein